MNFHNAVVENPCTKTRQEFLLFCICVAGKKADMIVPKLRQFLQGCRNDELPFKLIDRLSINSIVDRLKECKMGRYEILARAFAACAIHINVDATSVTFLEKLPGIGPKTARYFMVYAHGEKHAIIDTHVKKFLRAIGCDSNRYYAMENVYLSICGAVGLEPRVLDDIIWRYHARGEMVQEYKDVVDSLVVESLVSMYDLA